MQYELDSPRRGLKRWALEVHGDHAHASPGEAESPAVTIRVCVPVFSASRPVRSTRPRRSSRATWTCAATWAWRRGSARCSARGPRFDRPLRRDRIHGPARHPRAGRGRRRVRARRPQSREAGARLARARRAAPVRVASVDDGPSLRALVDGADVLINCAGPFTYAGEPVVRAAIDAGVHYVDSTGEQSFMRMVFDRYGPDAERRGLALKACLRVRLRARRLHRPAGGARARAARRADDRLCREGPWMSRGTMLSAIEMMKPGHAVEYVDGAWRPASPGIYRASFDFGEPVGRAPVSPYPQARRSPFRATPMCGPCAPS